MVDDQPVSNPNNLFPEPPANNLTSDSPLPSQPASGGGDPSPSEERVVTPPAVPPQPVIAAPVSVVAPEVPVVPVTPVVSAPPAIPPTPSTSVYEGKGMGKYRVVVIKDKCIGAASCVAVASKAFKLNDQQIAEVIPSVNQESDESLLMAAQSCPTLAIEVYDTITGEKIWPK